MCIRFLTISEFQLQKPLRHVPGCVVKHTYVNELGHDRSRQAPDSRACNRHGHMAMQRVPGKSIMGNETVQKHGRRADSVMANCKGWSAHLFPAASIYSHSLPVLISHNLAVEWRSLRADE